MRGRHSRLGRFSGGGWALLLIPLTAAALHAQADHTFIFPERPAQWESLLWPRATYTPSFTPAGARFARDQGGLDAGALRQRAGVWEVFLGERWVPFEPTSSHVTATRNYYRLGGGWGGGQNSGNIHQEAQHWHAEQLGLNMEDYMRLHTMDSVDLDYNKQFYLQICRAQHGGTCGPIQETEELSAVPKELSFKLTGEAGRFVSLLEVRVAGTNHRWAASISSPLKPEAGGPLRDLRMVLAPRNGAGSAIVEVAMEVSRGVAPGKYAAVIQLSAGSLIPKVKVPVSVVVGIVDNGDDGDDDEEAEQQRRRKRCLPLPSGEWVRFQVTDPASGKADVFVSAVPCPPSQP